MSQEDDSCFGKLWNIKATECAGGYDLAWVDKNGMHFRPKCDYFEACGREFRARQAAATAAQPPQAFAAPPAYAQRYAQPVKVPMVGQPQPAQPLAVRPAAPGIPQQYIQPPQPVQYVAPGQPAAYYPQQPQHPYFTMQAPAIAPQVEMMPRNWFAVPQVLAVHEPREERPWAALGVEIGRGMAMITGLVGADFFSNIRLLKKPGE